MSSIVLVTGLVLLPGVRPVEAQTAPGVLVVRYFKCSPEGAAVERLSRARPEVDQLVAEGKLMDYGLARHSWGDEWNVVDYWVAADLPSFQAAFNEVLRRYRDRAAQEPSRDGERPFGEICSAHKDNIYNLVAPPAQGLATPEGGSGGDGSRR